MHERAGRRARARENKGGGDCTVRCCARFLFKPVSARSEATNRGGRDEPT